MMKNIAGCSSMSKLKFILFITCVCSFALPFVHAARTSLRNCDGGLPVKLKELTISSGQNSILNVAVSIGKVVEEGAYAEVTVKLGMIKLLHTKFDICEEVTKLNDPRISCPFSPGDYEFSHSLPIQIPPANYAINVRLFDGERNKLGCFNLHVDMKK